MKTNPNPLFSPKAQGFRLKNFHFNELKHQTLFGFVGEGGRTNGTITIIKHKDLKKTLRAETTNVIKITTTKNPTSHEQRINMNK